MTQPAHHRDEVARHFTEDAGRWSAEYQRADYNSRRYRLRAEIASRMLQANRVEGGRLLDVGTGAGLQAVAAHNAGWRVVGADLTEEMIRNAAANEGPGWLVASADSLPFPDGAFDVVLMLGVIGYTPEPELAVRSVKNVLRPGGVLIISWHNRQSLFGTATAATKYVPRKVLSLLGRRGDGEAKGGFYLTHNQDWTLPAFTELIEGVGFSVMDHDAVDFGRFRPFGYRLWGDRVDIAMSRAVEALCARGPLRAMKRGAFTHVVAARAAS